VGRVIKILELLRLGNQFIQPIVWTRTAIKCFKVCKDDGFWLGWSGGRFLRSLHTRAKSYDHEIARDQRWCPKVVPRHFSNRVVILTCPRVWCEFKCDCALNHMLYQWISIHVESSHMIIYNKSTVVRFQSAMVSRFFESGLPPRGGYRRLLAA
jgi:hypothetical protein